MTSIPDHIELFIAASTPLLPWYALAAQAYYESSMNPTANSSAGAWGLAQFMPNTWAEFGEGGDPTDPADSIAAQVRYLMECWRILAPVRRTSWAWLIAAYTVGPYAARNASSFDTLSPDVTAHVSRVLSLTADYHRLSPMFSE